jgi:hypothetical protein
MGYENNREMFMNSVTANRHIWHPIDIPIEFQRFAINVGMDQFTEFIGGLMQFVPDQRLAPITL